MKHAPLTIFGGPSLVKQVPGPRRRGRPAPSGGLSTRVRPCYLRRALRDRPRSEAASRLQAWLRSLSPRRARAAGLIAAPLLLATCSNASHMFSGMWTTEATLDAEWFAGRPMLALGHFGPEITGVVWFLDAESLPDTACPCAFVDQQDVDLADRRFVATTTLCDGQTRLIWQLEYDDAGADPRLVGDVRLAADDTYPPLAVSFVLDDEFVPDERRECVTE